MGGIHKIPRVFDGFDQRWTGREWGDEPNGESVHGPEIEEKKINHDSHETPRAASGRNPNQWFGKSAPF